MYVNASIHICIYISVQDKSNQIKKRQQSKSMCMICRSRSCWYHKVTPFHPICLQHNLQARVWSVGDLAQTTGPSLQVAEWVIRAKWQDFYRVWSGPNNRTPSMWWSGWSGPNDRTLIVWRSGWSGPNNRTLSMWWSEWSGHVNTWIFSDATIFGFVSGMQWS